MGDYIVDFDDQPRAVTCEVGDVVPERDLPTEMSSVQLKLAKDFPETLFGSGLVTVEPLGRTITAFGGVNSARGARSTR